MALLRESRPMVDTSLLWMESLVEEDDKVNKMHAVITSKSELETGSDTDALSPVCLSMMALLRHTAPSSSIRLKDRSRIFSVSFCFRSPARCLAPSLVILLLHNKKTSQKNN